MRIVTFYQSSADHLRCIQRVAPAAEIIEAGPDDLANLLLEADIFFGHVKVPVDWPAVVKGKRLKWIQSSAAGMDHCLNPAVIESDIVVSSASGVFANQVAEQAMAMLLGLLRRLHEFIPAQTSKQFVRRPTDDLHNKRVGIIGAGGNGQRIAQVLAPYGNRLWATDVFIEQAIDGFERLLPPEDLDVMLENSEILIVTVPLLESTRHLLSTREFALMPEGAYVINVGRGEVIDEPALIAALQSGQLAGAGLDVAEIEPLPNESPLWDLPNVIITPHVGAQSSTRNDDVTQLFCENLDRFSRGETLINQIDKSLGFPIPELRFSGFAS